MEHNTNGVAVLNPGTVVTTGTPAATKGAAVQLIAATAFDAYWVRVVASDYGLAATDAQGALDIMIGAATEEVIIPDLLMGGCGTFGAVTNKSAKMWDFPL